MSAALHGLELQIQRTRRGPMDAWVRYQMDRKVSQFTAHAFATGLAAVASSKQG